MRLEIEMADISDQARHAVDEDMAQIDHTIGQLMEYARPANVAPRRGVNVSAIITEVYRRELSHTLAMGGLIKANIQPDLHARINEYDLKRIVANLIENARRYGRNPEDDKAHIRRSVELRGGKILIQVADKGPGIAADDITQLLRPFSRGDTARTGVSGAGLGLAIVERLLQQVGGHLELTTAKDGRGLAARIWLPRTRPTV